jgi:hypothetical protein
MPKKGRFFDKNEWCKGITSPELDEDGNWKFETGNSKPQIPKLEIRNSKLEDPKRASREATRGTAVFTSIELSRRERASLASEEKGGGQGGVEKKCEKMRFEATTLLKTKEVDLERTQVRTHRWAVSWPKMG